MQYEDMLSSQRPPRKPGYRSPPQRKTPSAESWRRDFSKQLISALEDATVADSQQRTAQQLAKTAYDKLQFDFPLVSEAELEALVTAFRTSLDADSWPSHPLTAKLLQNALEGSHLPPAPSTEGSTTGSAAAAQQIATNGTSAAAANGHSILPNGTAAHGPGTAAPWEGAAAQQPPAVQAASPPQQQQPDKLRQATLYQQLAVCLVVKLARRAIQAPPEEAFRQLAGFVPEPDDADTATASNDRAAQQQQQQQQQQQEQQATDGDATQEYVQRMQGAGAAPDMSGVQHPDGSGSRPQAAEAAHAVEEDGDDDVYEDLLPLPPPPPRFQPQQQGGYSWDALHVKLAALAAHAQYSALGWDAAWRQLRLSDDVTALVAAAMRHAHAADLAGVSSVYVELLAQRIADVPAAVSAFGPLCAALGASDASRVALRGLQVAMPGGLRSATAFAARTFATLLPAPGASAGAQSPTAAGRAAADARAAAARTLARGVYDALLPPLGAWLGAVAAAKPKGGPSAPSAPVARSEAAAAAADAEAIADVEADVVLVCRVVSPALVGAQAAGGGSKALLDAGVFRALVMLLANDRFPHMPELRVAVLLAAASDASLATWAAAVPSFVPALLAPCFQEGGEAAAEGAVWAHLLPAAKRPPMLPALERLLLVPDAPDAGGSLDACQQQVAALRSTLLLLADCRTASGGRRPWSDSAGSRLRALPAELNTLDMRLGTPSTAAAATASPVAQPGSAAAAVAPDTAAGSAQLPLGSVNSAQQLAVTPAAARGSAGPEAEAGADSVPAHAADEPPGHRLQAAAGAPCQQGTTTREAATVTALRRACRQCAKLAKDLAAGQAALSAAKRD